MRFERRKQCSSPHKAQPSPLRQMWTVMVLCMVREHPLPNSSREASHKGQRANREGVQRMSRAWQM